LAKKTKLRDVQVNCSGWVFDQPAIWKAKVTSVIKNTRGTVTGCVCELRYPDGDLMGEGVMFDREDFYHAPDELPRLVDAIHDAINGLLFDLKIFSAVLGSEMEKSHPTDDDDTDDDTKKVEVH